MVGVGTSLRGWRESEGRRLESARERASEKKEITATHTIGVMSTPATGGMRRRVARSSGSVGQAATLYGKALRLYLRARREE